MEGQLLYLVFVCIYFIEITNGKWLTELFLYLNIHRFVICNWKNKIIAVGKIVYFYKKFLAYYPILNKSKNNRKIEWKFLIFELNTFNLLY